MSFKPFSKICLLALVATGLMATEAMAQRGGGGRGGFFPESNLSLLLRPGVQEELDLVEDQIEEFKAMQDEMRSTMREEFMKARDEGLFEGGDRQKAMESMRAKMEDINKRFDQQTEGVLLDHQISRLTQLRVQSANRRSGGVSGGTMPKMVIEKLKITDEQLEEMKKKAEEVKKMMEEKIAKIRQQAEEEVLSVLTKQQREEYKEMVGDAYKFQDNNRFQRGGDRGGAGGDRGGAGGDRGGRGGDRGGDRGGRGGDRGGDRGGERSDF